MATGPALAFGRPYVRTIWYMGAKTRMIGEILQAIASADPCADTVLDLMSGTAVVSQSLAPNYRVVSNDVQAYAASIARAYLESPAQPGFVTALDFEGDLGERYREHRDALLGHLAPAVALEDAFLEAYGFEPEAADPAVGTVFGHRSARRDLARARRRVPQDAADRARAYRAFALRDTPLFHEDLDVATPGVWRGAKALFSRAAIAARRQEPGLFPYLLASTTTPTCIWASAKRSPWTACATRSTRSPRVRATRPGSAGTTWQPSCTPARWPPRPPATSASRAGW